MSITTLYVVEEEELEETNERVEYLVEVLGAERRLWHIVEQVDVQQRHVHYGRLVEERIGLAATTTHCNIT